MHSTLDTLNQKETYYPKSTIKAVDYLDDISKSDRNRQKILEHQIDQKLHLLGRAGYAVEIVENSRNISIDQVLEFNKLCTYLATLKDDDFTTIANKIDWFRLNNKNSIQTVLEKFNSLKLNIDDKNTIVETTAGPTFTRTYEEKITVVKPTMLRDVSTKVTEIVELQSNILKNTPKKSDYIEKPEQKSLTKSKAGIFNKLSKFWKKLWS